MRAVTLCIVASLVIPFTGPSLIAQPNPNSPNLAWLTLGLGLSRGSHGGDVAALAEAGLQRGVHLFSARVVPFGDPNESESWAEVGFEAALLYGRTHRGRHHHASLSAGPALVWCEDANSCWASRGEVDFGFAVSGQIFLTSLRYAGVGLYGFANINTADPFFGAMLALRFGKLGG